MNCQERVGAYLTARHRNGYRGDLIHRVWTQMRSVELTEADLQALLNERTATGDQLDRVYRERARLIALLAAVFPSAWAHADLESPHWPIVFVSTPEGQLSWHISPEDWDLFAHVPRAAQTGALWDGHSTRKKHKRIERLCAGYRYLPPMPVNTPGDQRG